MTEMVKKILSSKKTSTKIKENLNGYIFTKKVKDNIYDVKISDFLLNVIDIIQNEDNEDVSRKLIIEITYKGQKDFGTFTSSEICDFGNFKKKIKSLNPACGFYEMDGKILEELIIYLQEDKKIPYTILVNKKGYIPKYNCWSTLNGIIFNKKLYPYNELKVADLGHIRLKLDNDKIDDNFFIPEIDEKIYDPEIKFKISNYFNHMFGEVNGDLVLGFLISSLFVNSLKRELNPFPILFISGKMLSGKTTATTIALKILGLSGKGAAESDSVYIDERNANIISSLPYFSDEFKNKSKTQEKESFYKNLYDRNGVSKGVIKNKILSAEKLEICSTLILSGEQTPDDDAVYSRICLIDVPSKRNGNLFEEIKQKIDYFPSVIQDILLKNDFFELVGKYKKILEQTKGKLKEKGVDKRMLDVYGPIVAGYFFYEKVILGKEVKQDFLEKIEKHAKQKEQENDNDVTEEFFDQISYLSERLHIDILEHIRYQELNKKILFNFQFLYLLYAEKNYDKIPKKVLKKYIISKYNPGDTSMSRTEGGKYSHVMSFDIDNIPESLRKYIKNEENPF